MLAFFFLLCFVEIKTIIFFKIASFLKFGVYSRRVLLKVDNNEEWFDLPTPQNILYQCDRQSEGGLCIVMILICISSQYQCQNAYFQLNSLFLCNYSQFIAMIEYLCVGTFQIYVTVKIYKKGVLLIQKNFEFVTSVVDNQIVCGLEQVDIYI
eukprot:TRINITY_DN6505_c0_g2_i1.p3 TRINITY_DN6505_c0_g2~~TRINITY_DN6505_c0_g2_i1.p3  ORF type:complete len:170 (-),score=9.50 TRINITY_DN6505_c0_g2_i1:191-649(-)